MAPHITMPLAMIPVVAFMIWRRIRVQFGPQPIRRKRMIARIAIFAVIGCLIGFAAIHNTLILDGLAGGVIAGAALGLLGLRLSRFELDPVKGSGRRHATCPWSEHWPEPADPGDVRPVRGVLHLLLHRIADPSSAHR
jgi:hypothetical protein